MMLLEVKEKRKETDLSTCEYAQSQPKTVDSTRVSDNRPSCAQRRYSIGRIPAMTRPIVLSGDSAIESFAH